MSYRLMADSLNGEAHKNHTGSPSPRKFGRLSNSIKLNPNLWGVGGRGVRGKPLAEETVACQSV